MHSAQQCCSSVKYSRYSPSSGLAGQTTWRPRYVTVFMNWTTKAWCWSVRRGLFALGGTTCSLVWRLFPGRRCSGKVNTLDRNDNPDTDAFSALFYSGARKKGLESVSDNGMYSPTETSSASSPVAKRGPEKIQHSLASDN